MANSTDLVSERGQCPPPFLDKAKFSDKGGHLGGRLCSQISPGLNCCLPCPATDWIYPPNFQTWYKVTESLSAIGVAICIFLLVTWAVLPVEKTRRHYLSICLVVGILFEAIAFVIPLGARPNQCYNDITPHDMHSDYTCAFSGAFIVAGGLSVSMWIMIRAISMHLQICWDIVPGKKFFFASLIAGWGLVALLFTVTMAFTGVSYRFGDLCHVNSTHSMADFWGPLLAIAGLAATVQIMTFLYCFKVYLSNIWSDERTRSNDSNGLPSYTSSRGTASAKVVYQRVKKVLWLQWRSITIIIFLLVDTIFFAVVWIQLDSSVTQLQQGQVEHILPFLFCLIGSAGDKQKCYAIGQSALVNESTSVAILMLLSLTGIQTGLTLCRTSMFVGWMELIKKRLGSKREFVSLDAKRFSSDPRTIELLKVNTQQPRGDTGDASISRMDTFESKESQSQTSPPIRWESIRQSSPQSHQSGSPQPQPMERQYKKPRMSFSGPRGPTPVREEVEARPSWDPSETFASSNHNPAIGSIGSIHAPGQQQQRYGGSPRSVSRDRFGNRMI